jgi:hypothetical protein
VRSSCTRATAPSLGRPISLAPPPRTESGPTSGRCQAARGCRRDPASACTTTTSRPPSGGSVCHMTSWWRNGDVRWRHGDVMAWLCCDVVSVRMYVITSRPPSGGSVCHVMWRHGDVMAPLTHWLLGSDCHGNCCRGERHWPHWRHCARVRPFLWPPWYGQCSVLGFVRHGLIHACKSSTAVSSFHLPSQ